MLKGRCKVLLQGRDNHCFRYFRAVSGIQKLPGVHDLTACVDLQSVCLPAGVMDIRKLEGTCVNLSLSSIPVRMFSVEATHERSCSGITFISQTSVKFLCESENEASQAVRSFHETQGGVLIFQLFWSVK